MHKLIVSNDKICCPYSKCQNRRFLGRDDVTYHLTKMNLLEHILSGLHTMNLLHRNKIQNQFKSCSIDCMNPTNYISNSKSMVIEAIDMNGDTIGVDNYETRVELEKPNLEVLKFYTCLHDANAPLLEVCRNHIRLSTISQLLICMSEFHTSDNNFDKLMSMLRSMLRDENLLPSNFYNTKNMMSTLGFGYPKIHVCINICILYYNENINIDVYCITMKISTKLHVYKSK